MCYDEKCFPRFWELAATTIEEIFGIFENGVEYVPRFHEKHQGIVEIKISRKEHLECEDFKNVEFDYLTNTASLSLTIKNRNFSDLLF